MVHNLPTTLTLNSHRAMLPLGSVNVYTTRVLPSGNVVLDSWVLVMVRAAPELSVAVGSIHSTSAKLALTSALCVMSLGQFLTSGGTLSPAAVEAMWSYYYWQGVFDYDNF